VEMQTCGPKEHHRQARREKVEAWPTIEEAIQCRLAEKHGERSFGNPSPACEDRRELVPSFNEGDDYYRDDKRASSSDQERRPGHGGDL
jgi:hypothetical protein